MFTKKVSKLSEKHDLSLILDIEHRKIGLSLCEDEDFVYLIKNGKEVARFYNGPSLTILAIHHEADTWLGYDAVADAIREGGISFGEAR